MTASELVALIEGAGGSVALSPDRQHVRCKLPRAAGSLLEQVRLHREEVLKLLKDGHGQLAGHTNERGQVASICDGGLGPLLVAGIVGQWLRKRCVVAARCASNPQILYREFSSWANTTVLTTAALPYEAFISELRELGWRSNEDGMIVGLCLGEDFLAAVEMERALRRQVLN